MNYFINLIHDNNIEIDWEHPTIKEARKEVGTATEKLDVAIT